MRKEMSRQVIVYRGKEHEQKGSGVIIATGAGSTGWSDSAGYYQFQGKNIFPKTEKKGFFIITEPYRYKLKEGAVLSGDFTKDEELAIYSLNDSEGSAASDSWEEYSFIRGQKAVVRISDNTLKVVEPS